MTLIGHLDELRKRIIVIAIAFVAFFIIGFIYVKDIYNWFVADLPFKLTILGPGEIIWIYFKLAGIAALTGTIPIILWQIWLFIKPALTDREKKLTLSYIPASFVLFIGGLAFGYYVIFPSIFNFLLGMNDGMFDTMFTIEKYFNFLIRTTMPFSFLFELPVVAMFLTSLGIVTPALLVKLRKFAYFILVIVAAMITPPDFISQTIVAIPLILIYEVSILLSKVVFRRKQEQTAKLYEDE